MVVYCIYLLSVALRRIFTAFTLQPLKDEFFCNRSLAFSADKWFLTAWHNEGRSSGYWRQRLFFPVFSPRVLGVAVARYDFFARDTQELSLLQGDVIRVYTKLPNAWWKGQVDGRVGLQILLWARFLNHLFEWFLLLQFIEAVVADTRCTFTPDQVVGSRSTGV